MPKIWRGKWRRWWWISIFWLWFHLRYEHRRYRREHHRYSRCYLMGLVSLCSKAWYLNLSFGLRIRLTEWWWTWKSKQTSILFPLCCFFVLIIKLLWICWLLKRKFIVFINSSIKSIMKIVSWKNWLIDPLIGSLIMNYSFFNSPYPIQNYKCFHFYSAIGPFEVTTICNSIREEAVPVELVVEVMV